MLLGDGLRLFTGGLNRPFDALFAVGNPAFPSSQPDADRSGDEASRLSNRSRGGMDKIVIELARDIRFGERAKRVVGHRASLPWGDEGGPAPT